MRLRRRRGLKGERVSGAPPNAPIFGGRPGLSPQIQPPQGKPSTGEAPKAHQKIAPSPIGIVHHRPPNHAPPSFLEQCNTPAQEPIPTTCQPTLKSIWVPPGLFGLARGGGPGLAAAGHSLAAATAGGLGRVFLKRGGGPRGVGGWGCGGGPPPSADPELLEAPKAPKKLFGLN